MVGNAAEIGPGQTAFERNDRVIDIWSAVHLTSAMLMGWVMDPFIALLLLIAYEPLELFVLYPLSMKLFNYPFGYESWRNSWSDMQFDAAGVALGYYGLRRLADAPFTLF